MLVFHVHIFYNIYVPIQLYKEVKRMQPRIGIITSGKTRQSVSHNK